MRRSDKFREELSSPKKMELTIEKLVQEGYLPPERGMALKESLPDIIERSEYVLFNLGAHISIGLIFAFDLIPLPLGTISRDIWVIGNRLYYEVRMNNEKKKFHSFKVLVVSTIPFVGYFSYTLALKEVNEDATYLYANHVSYLLRGTSLEEFLEKMPRTIQKVGRRILVPGYLVELRGE
ncbi:MAG: hypothetical protein SVM80_04320 [Halobacteriota archaeon]|nr:hypothetical protein [Halobacteriota archaeon]